MLPRAGAAGCHQGVAQSRLEGTELLDALKQKARMGTEAKARGPPPAWGSPVPRPGGSCRGAPGRSGPLGRASCPRRGVLGKRGARGAPHPARPHPARAPQSAPGAARAMLAAPAAASARAENRRHHRRRRPDPLAPRLPRAPVAGHSRPRRPCPTGASRRRRHLGPVPPPTPAQLEGKGGGKGGGCPLPIHILRGSPPPPPPARARACWDVESSRL